MKIIPNHSIVRSLATYFDVFMDLLIVWIICRIMIFVLTIIGLFLAIKYAAYIPDNPSYRRNYDDIKVLPRNPFTEAPAYMKQSEIDALKNKH